MSFRLALVVLATALTVAACAGSSGGEPGPGGLAPGVSQTLDLSEGSGVGPGISPGEALAFRLEGPLLVRGWLWRADGSDPRLCSGLTGSIPPECTKPWLTVKGLLDLTKVELRTEGGATWSPQPVLLLGDVAGGVLSVSGLSRG